MTKMNYPELEIGLHRRDAASYAVQVRFRDPDQEAEQRAEAYPVRFDFEQLRELAVDPAAYGRQLGRNLLGQAEVRSCLDKARTVAQTSERRLRLRLCIDRWSLDLHGLRWETLRDPETDRSLLMDDNILFSRFLGSFDMRPVRLRSKTDLRALVAVANPSDLAQRKPGGRTLAAVDEAGELQRARDSLDGVAVTELAGEQHVTLDVILQHLRDDYDVFYLVCHGALIDDEPRLWLEDESGASKVIAGTDLIDGLARLVRLPRLVVLASCQSAGSGEEARSDDRGVLAALGPRLAEAGIPAVVAMQGNIQQRTIAAFMPVFFRELRKDGQIDRAMTEARFTVRELPDYWSPVLYTRLITGRLWYEQRFAKKGADFEIWDGLIDQIRDGSLVPILGSGLMEPYVGSAREFARSWADKCQYPMAESFQYDLHQVAQYISTTQGKAFAINDCVRELSNQMLQHWPDLAQETTAEGAESPQQRLLRLLSEVRELRLQNHTAEPYEVLAQLSCPLYLTTNLGNLLTDALQAAGKTPHTNRSRWRDEGGRFAESSDLEALAPTVEHPLVFQLYGHLSDKRSIVLTEDDFFEYLIGITQLQNRPQPSVLLEKLTDSGLMFLGFRIEDWEFRVFIHLLQSLQGNKLRGFYKNVAVQLDPEEGLGTDLDRARRYLEKYFGTPAMQIEIYWGSAEDFLQELNQRWQAQT
jgi:hypothetical protein